jgi:hypothetical protein
MSSDPSTQGLATGQSAAHTEDSHERQERIRQLADMFIDMFQARKQNNELAPAVLAEAA